MLCSRFMRPESGEHGRIYGIVEAGFNSLLAGYRHTLDIVLRHQAITLGVFFATMALTGVMVVQIPKGFFPMQDIGVLLGFAEAAQSASPQQMMRLMQEQDEITEYARKKIGILLQEKERTRIIVQNLLRFAREAQP